MAEKQKVKETNVEILDDKIGVVMFEELDFGESISLAKLTQRVQKKIKEFKISATEVEAILRKYPKIFICASGLWRVIDEEEPVAPVARAPEPEPVQKMKCPRCAGHTIMAGTRVYVSGKYRMRRCVACGHQFRGEQLTTKRERDNP